VVFLSKKQFYQKVLPNLVEKTKQEHVLPKLIKCNIATFSFDLWMSRGVHVIIVLVIMYLKIGSQPKHVILSFFKQHKLPIKPWQEIEHNCWMNMG
jgi:hypothetical protein